MKVSQLQKVGFALALSCVVAVSGSMQVSATYSDMVKDGVRFIDANTIRVESYEDPEHICGTGINYYKILDGVVYGAEEHDMRHAGVLYISPTEPGAKIRVLGEIRYYEDSDEVSTVDVDLKEPISKNVEEIEFMDGISKIAGISSSNSLLRVFISKDVSSIRGFWGCPNLEMIIDEANPYFKVENGALYQERDGKVSLESVFAANTDYSIREDVSCFHAPFGTDAIVKNLYVNSDMDELVTGKMAALENVIFADTVRYIGKLDVSNTKQLCKVDFSKIKVGTFCAKGAALTTAMLPEGVTLKDGAFYNCTNLKTVVLPKSLKKIPCEAFRKAGLKKITIPQNVKVIDVSAFQGCGKLATVTIDNKKKAPTIRKNAFKNTKTGLRFVVKNKKVAKDLQKKLKGKGVKSAKIYVGKKLLYKNIK